MRTRSVVALGGALVACACSSTGTGAGVSDATVDSARTAEGGLDGAFSGDAAGDSGGSCAPAGATSSDDAGGGCHPVPAITINGVDVCASDQYAVVCDGVPQPLESLQCQQLALPTPQGVDFFCCPCLPATCVQSVAVGCARDNLARCPMTLGAARTLCDADAGTNRLGATRGARHPVRGVSTTTSS